MRKLEFILPIFALLLLSGCSIDRDTKLQDSLHGGSVEDNISGYAIFNPTESLIPYPNSILFAPNSSSTDQYDGGKTLNIPYEPNDSDAAIKRQLNELTGFSTISPITTNITEGLELNSSTLATGVGVYKVDVNSTTGAVMQITSTLNFGVDYVVSQSGSKIAIVPIRPLESLTNYMIVLTDEIKSTDGKRLAPDIGTALTLKSTPIDANHTAAALEPVRQATQAMLGALIKAGKNPRKTIQIWSFRTQLIGATQRSIAAVPAVSTITLTSTGKTSLELTSDAQTIGKADVYIGTLNNLPQFMPQPSAADPMPILNGQFSYRAGSLTPILEANITVPLFATIPNSHSGCAKPADGWSVIIYQHGITRNRTDLAAFGETFASKCYAAVAIDLPLHGVVETNLTKNPFYLGALERTYNADLVAQNAQGVITAANSDGIIDSSGAHYINLSHIATTRDNLHQSTSDLLQLHSALSKATGVDLNKNRVHFVAHSLGTIASTGYLNSTNNLETIALIVPGQGLSLLLASSKTYGPVIAAGLAAKGIEQNTVEYSTFLLATQTIVDDADPANYALSLAQKHPKNILAFEMVGSRDTASQLPCQVADNSDSVIPNCVVGAPLSGTDPFLKLINADNINLTNGNAGLKPISSNTVVRLTAGTHSSPLRPDAATVSIHTMIMSHLESNSKAIYVSDPSIILQ